MVNPQGVILMVIGVMLLPRQIIEFLIRANNSMRGVKTEITKSTIIFYRIIASIFILLGLAFML